MKRRKYEEDQLIVSNSSEFKNNSHAFGKKEIEKSKRNSRNEKLIFDG